MVSEEEMRRCERENLEAALERTGWRVYGAGGAAELLGIKPTPLSSRIKKMGLRKPGQRRAGCFGACGKTVETGLGRYGEGSTSRRGFQTVSIRTRAKRRFPTLSR